ncbi:unnamed protein product [Prunus armeniaca]
MSFEPSRSRCRSSRLGLDVVRAVSVSMSFEPSRSRCRDPVIVIVENPFHGRISFVGEPSIGAVHME